MGTAKLCAMTSLTSLDTESEPAPAATLDRSPAVCATCYSLTVFTLRWHETRDFYVEILGARVVSERADRYCELEVGGLPICLRQCEHGEMISYLHFYIALKNRDAVLNELRRRGIIVTTVGPYTNFRDPEGRVIKLSHEKTMVV